MLFLRLCGVSDSARRSGAAFLGEELPEIMSDMRPSQKQLMNVAVPQSLDEGLYISADMVHRGHCLCGVVMVTL